MNESAIEQKVFDFVVANARETIFNETGVKSILTKMGSGDPTSTIGHTAAMILKSVAGGIKKSGLTVPPEIMQAAYKEIVGDLVELASVNGLVPEEAKRDVAVAAAKAGIPALKPAPPGYQSPAAQPQQQPAQQPPVNAGGLINQAMEA